MYVFLCVRVCASLFALGFALEYINETVVARVLWVNLTVLVLVHNVTYCSL